MTEELKQKAEDYIKKNCDRWEADGLTVDEIVKCSLVEFATETTKELEAQIEKMKCCENCHHWEDREPIPSSAEEGYFCYNDHNGICKRWELAKEDDYYRR